MLSFLTSVTWIEWLVVALTTAVCLLGAVLPALGNLLGRLFLGEDPLLARWQHARQLRRQAASAQRQARKDAKRQKKAARAEARSKPAPGSAAASAAPATGTAPGTASATSASPDL